MKEDFRNFMRRFSGEPKKKRPAPGSNESFDDWKDAFESGEEKEKTEMRDDGYLYGGQGGGL
jgi:hypothetical protein